MKIRTEWGVPSKACYKTDALCECDSESVTEARGVRKFQDLADFIIVTIAFPSHPSRIRAAVVFLYGSEEHSTNSTRRKSEEKKEDGGRVSLGRSVHALVALARPLSPHQSSRLSAPLFFSSCPVNVSSLPPLTSAGQKLSQFVFMVHYFHFWRFLASPS